MAEIGVGLIGFGLGGSVFHAPFIQATDGLVLKAVVSRDAAKVHAKLPEVDVVSSVEALLTRSEIDLVVVSSPDALHAEHAIAALTAGKHVLVDKPFATTLADAQRMAATASQTGKLLSVFQNRRWDADFLTLKRLMGDGALGRIVHFESHFDRWRPEPAPTWKDAREGGSWLDLGPHLVDQALCLFGRPEAITTDMAILRPGALAADWFHTILHYPKMRAILHSSKLSVDHSLRFAVHGTSASWIKHGTDTQEAAIIGGAKPGSVDLGIDTVAGTYTSAMHRDCSEPVPNERGDYGRFWQALMSAIRGEGPNPTPPSEALLVMEVLEAGLQSAASNQTVKL